MKKITLILFLAASIFKFADAQVLEDKIIILESQRSVLRLQLMYDAKAVKSALAEKLKSQGVKTKSSKGFTVASESKLIEITPDLLDYYFKVEALDKKSAVLYLGFSKGYDNFIDPTSNLPLWQSGMKFVESMTEYLSTYQLKNNANNLEKELSTAQKNYDKSVQSLKKQEEEVVKSRKELEEAQKDLEMKKVALDKMRGSIK